VFCLRPYLTGAGLALKPATGMFLVTATPALASAHATVAPAGLALSTFAGSAIWWLFLSVTITTLRRWVSPRALRTLNKGTGGLLIIAGILLLARAFFR
jgi:threonine/homoserine/homoserine lactone efflux protein